MIKMSRAKMVNSAETGLFAIAAAMSRFPLRARGSAGKPDPGNLLVEFQLDFLLQVAGRLDKRIVAADLLDLSFIGEESITPQSWPR
jgi:hypothetical protein